MTYPYTSATVATAPHPCQPNQALALSTLRIRRGQIKSLNGAKQAGETHSVRGRTREALLAYTGDEEDETKD